MFLEPYRTEENMKLKFVFATIFLLFGLDSCRGKGNSAFLFPITNAGEFKLFYEPINVVASEIPKEILEEWKHPGVRIKTAPGIVCLFSGTVSVFGISICFPDQKGDVELELQNILKLWNTNLDSRTEPEFFEFSSNGQASVWIQQNRDLLENINEDWLILSGSKELDRMLQKEKFPELNRVSVFSENSILKPHSTNAFVGFSVLATNEKIRVLFSSEDFISSKNTLVVDIPGDVSILSEFLLEIQKQNLQITSLCKTDLPVLSEIFGGTESPIGRFLELNNPQKDPICFQDLELETSSGTYSLLAGPQFLIPGETILKVETGSVLPGGESVSFPWSDLKKKGDWILKSKDAKNVYKNSEKTFLEGGRYYSSHEDFYSICSNFFLSDVLERFCMDPGFGVSKQSQEWNDPPFCDSSAFQIEEANFTGLYLDGKVDQKQKFIDLEYSGNSICNPNSLSLENEGKEIPVWLDSKVIRPGGIFTLGKRDFLKKDVLVSPSELKDFEFGKSVFLKDRISKKISILSNDSSEIPILTKTDGSVVSLLWRENVWIPHPISSSNALSVEIQNFHSMNPGRKTDLADSAWKSFADVSEISWMGSYDGTVSVSADRFIEIDSASITSRILEIISGNKNYRFILPLKPGRNVLSIGKLVCFPKVETWIAPELSLGSKGKIRLLFVDGNIENDWISWDSLGINSTSQKLRRSASKIRTLSGASVWKNSALSDVSSRKTSCIGTEASPGLENRSLPFFQKEYSENLISILDPWISFNLDRNSPSDGSIQVFTFQPNGSVRLSTSGFLNLWSDLRSGILGSLNIRKEVLNYLVPVGGEELVGIPGSSGILISAVYPNPTVSTNEWLSICNWGLESVDVRSLEIRDSSSADRLVEYSFRFGANPPLGWINYNPTSFGWIFADRFLNSGECGYVLSPNFKNESVPFHSTTFRKVFTIDKTTTIGNGIGKNEGLDLFQEIQGNLVHIHSYGNQFSPFPFSIDADTDDLILLKENRSGDSSSDYEIEKKGNL
ncbi:hypothetical protein LEP1GSC036_1128 [Leptospira weilii str. 2006001853]|uniref:Lipoprotein n=2 Tax=Leptospira weilii TaxID=28184 RepID=A0A828Z194_9LEPT|nr:hypothetical protein LEP1GSC036_1128 [Leptospira weilii str. 2006001853]EMN44877.1 hypothetical protein LEP1GSC086_0214 [Leptospira weilii str. LNT 1234]